MELDLDVDLREDGSGTVAVVVGLDADGLSRIGGDLRAVLELDDLVAAGWTVDGPALEEDGFTRVTVSRGFGTPEEAADVFAQIAGDAGPFQGLRVTRERKLAETRYGFEGTIDFRGGLEAFGDERIAAELDGEPIGQSVEEIEAQLGESLSSLLQLRVRARLPGGVTSNAATDSAGAAVWQVGFGEGTVDMAATGTQRRWATLGLAALAAAALVALLVVLLVRLARRTTGTTASATSADTPPPGG